MEQVGKSNTKQKLFACLALGILVVVLVSAITFLVKKPSVIFVNGEAIYATDTDAEIARLTETTPELFTEENGGQSSDQLRDAFLNSLIDESLLTQEALRRGLDVSDSAIQKSTAVQYAS